MNVFGCMHRTSPPAGRTHTQGPAQASAERVRTRAHIGGAAAHNGPRRIEARPSASAIVRAAGPGAAHTWYNVMTRAVFHAPMSALKAAAPLNTCVPTPHAVDTDGQGLNPDRFSHIQING